VAGAVLSFGLLPLPAAAFAAVLAALALYVAAVDLDRLIIPDLANAAIFVLGLALVLTEAFPGGHLAALQDALLRSAIAGGLLYLMRFAYARLTGVFGLGLGDVKLAAAGAPFLPWQTLPMALALSAIAGVLVVVTRAIVRREMLDRRVELPFGAFLAPAIWLTFVLGRIGLFAV
jgi:leader peptidase (prepilin peptidase)/N-methyltransferase